MLLGIKESIVYMEKPSKCPWKESQKRPSRAGTNHLSGSCKQRSVRGRKIMVMKSALVNLKAVVEEGSLSQLSKEQIHRWEQAFPIIILSKQMQDAHILREAGDRTFGALREKLIEKWTDSVASCTLKKHYKSHINVRKYLWAYQAGVQKGRDISDSPGSAYSQRTPGYLRINCWLSPIPWRRHATWVYHNL